MAARYTGKTIALTFNMSKLSILGQVSADLIDLVQKCLPKVCTVYPMVRSQKFASGSGWAYDSDLVVTNNHVADGTTHELMIRSQKYGEVRAELVGTDYDTDLAVLRLVDLQLAPFEVRALPPRVGELCVTLGTPLGDRHQDSVSLGVVSGTGRQVPKSETTKFEEVVQIDALINQGNSGGPLIDSDGQVIGVNFAGHLGRDGSASGINYAISSEVVRDVIPELIEHGRIARGSIGISISARTRKIDNRFVSCLQVVQTASNESPLKPGDFIMKVNEQSVHRRYDLMRLLNRGVIGQDVRLQIERSSKRMEVDVRVSARSN